MHWGNAIFFICIQIHTLSFTFLHMHWFFLLAYVYFVSPLFSFWKVYMVIFLLVLFEEPILSKHIIFQIHRCSNSWRSLSPRNRSVYNDPSCNGLISTLSSVSASCSTVACKYWSLLLVSNVLVISNHRLAINN